MARSLTMEMLQASMDRLFQDTKVEPETIYCCSLAQYREARKLYPHHIISVPARVYRAWKAEQNGELPDGG